MLFSCCCLWWLDLCYVLNSLWCFCPSVYNRQILTQQTDNASVCMFRFLSVAISLSHCLLSMLLQFHLHHLPTTLGANNLFPCVCRRNNNKSKMHHWEQVISTSYKTGYTKCNGFSIKCGAVAFFFLEKHLFLQLQLIWLQIPWTGTRALPI